jgi:hypothetical protein
MPQPLSPSGRILRSLRMILLSTRAGGVGGGVPGKSFQIASHVSAPEGGVSLLNLPMPILYPVPHGLSSTSSTSLFHATSLLLRIWAFSSFSLSLYFSPVCCLFASFPFVLVIVLLSVAQAARVFAISGVHQYAGFRQFLPQYFFFSTRLHVCSIVPVSSPTESSRISPTLFSSSLAKSSSDSFLQSHPAPVFLSISFSLDPSISYVMSRWSLRVSVSSTFHFRTLWWHL